MISRLPLRTQPLYSIRRAQRLFSVIAIHSSFPASLLRYNSRQRSSLFDYKKLHEREDDPIDDGVEVSENGLVYPSVSKRLPCLYSIDHDVSEPRPNSIHSFQRGDTHAEHLYDAREHPDLLRPVYRRWRRWQRCRDSVCLLCSQGCARAMSLSNIHSHYLGTPIPGHLILLHEHTARFSLQPSHPIPIEGMCLQPVHVQWTDRALWSTELNKLLDEFYAKYAEAKTAEQWLDGNEFSSAVADAAVATWMAK
jgi:hypothetical protein